MLLTRLKRAILGPYLFVALTTACAFRPMTQGDSYTPAATGPDGPEIVSLTVDPEIVDWDETLTISWETRNATYVDISVGRGSDKYHELFWSEDGLPPSGSLQISADLRSRHHVFGRHTSDRRISLVAHAINTQGTVAQTTHASFEILVRCPYPLFFGVDPFYAYQWDPLYSSQGGCGNDDPYTAETIYQPFQHGAIMKVEVRRPVGTATKALILFEDGSVVWYATPQPGDLPAAPRGLFPPGNHLANLWNGYVGEQGQESISDRLGWATAEEQMYSAAIQLGAAALYVEQPGGQIMRFSESSSEPVSWQIIPDARTN